MSTSTSKSSSSKPTSHVNGKSNPTHGGPKPAPTTKPKDTGATTKPAAAAAPAREAKLPVHRRVERQLKIAAKRWATFVRLTKGWSPDIDIAVNEVAEDITAALQAISKLPDNFVPPRRAGGGAGAGPQLVIGSLANITEKATTRYKDVLEDGDLKNLELLKIAGGKKLVFRTQSGDRVIIPRGHVKPTGEMAPKKPAPIVAAAAESTPTNPTN